MKEELEKFRAENPKISEQFADLKRKLADVPAEQVGWRGWRVPAGGQGSREDAMALRWREMQGELVLSGRHRSTSQHTRHTPWAQWEAIPDIGDYTIKKQKHLDRFTPVPDSLLASAAAREATATAIDASGLATPMGGATTDLTAIGAGRNTVVQVRRPALAAATARNDVFFKRALPEGAAQQLTLWRARPACCCCCCGAPPCCPRPAATPWLVGGRKARRACSMPLCPALAPPRPPQLKLDKISDSVSGQTVVDPKGYLTDLKSVTLKSGAPARRHLR